MLTPELLQDFLSFFEGAALLEAACAGLKAQGYAIAEASPRAHAYSDAENHYGPLSMYLAAGFRVHRKDADGTVYVRRSLL